MPFVPPHRTTYVFDFPWPPVCLLVSNISLWIPGNTDQSFLDTVWKISQDKPTWTCERSICWLTPAAQSTSCVWRWWCLAAGLASSLWWSLAVDAECREIPKSLQKLLLGTHYAPVSRDVNHNSLRRNKVLSLNLPPTDKSTTSKYCTVQISLTKRDLLRFEMPASQPNPSNNLKVGHFTYMDMKQQVWQNLCNNCDYQ